MACDVGLGNNSVTVLAIRLTVGGQDCESLPARTPACADEEDTMNRTHSGCDHDATKAARAACRRRAQAKTYDPTEVRVVRVVPAAGRTPFYAVVKGTDVLETCVTRKEANEYAASARAMDLHFGCYGE